MRLVIQRVRKASVEVDGERISDIGHGLAVLAGVGSDDDEKDIEYAIRKISQLRIFEDDSGKMNLSVKDVNGEVLVVSQFTLFGDVRKGNRPSFDKAASFDKGKHLYYKLLEGLRAGGLKVKEGRYGAHMVVMFENDGPVTILIDTKKTF